MTFFGTQKNIFLEKNIVIFIYFFAHAVKSQLVQSVLFGPSAVLHSILFLIRRKKVRINIGLE